MSAAWLSLTPDGRYLTYSGMGHVLQVWNLPSLAAEMKALGLPWRGPEWMPTTPPPAVTKLTVDPMP